MHILWAALCVMNEQGFTSSVLPSHHHHSLAIWTAVTIASHDSKGSLHQVSQWCGACLLSSFSRSMASECKVFFPFPTGYGHAAALSSNAACTMQTIAGFVILVMQHCLCNHAAVAAYDSLLLNFRGRPNTHCLGLAINCLMCMSYRAICHMGPYALLLLISACLQAHQ